jgi:hypothetical protein
LVLPALPEDSENILDKIGDTPGSRVWVQTKDYFLVSTLILFLSSEKTNNRLKNVALIAIGQGGQDTLR